MTTAPLLSVFVTNYNYGAFIEASLNAILSQSRPADEVIVVDDGSTDGSPALIEEMARRHPTLRLIRHERNRGVYAALETALAAVRGTYLATLAADDPILPGHFERSLQVLQQHPQAGLCSSDYVFLNPEGALRSVQLGLVDRPTYISPQGYRKLLRERGEVSLPTSTALWRREALLQNSGYNHWDLRWHHDWMAGHVLALRHGVCYVPTVSQVVRLDDQSTSMSGMRSGAPYDELLRYVLRLIATPAFADVRDGFRLPGLMSRFGLRLLRLLAENPEHHALLSREMIIAVVKSETWLDCHIEAITAESRTQEQLVQITRGLLRTVAGSCRTQAAQGFDQGEGRTPGLEHQRRALAADPNAVAGLKLTCDFIQLDKIDDAAAACDSYCRSYAEGQGAVGDVFLARSLIAWRQGDKAQAEAILREAFKTAPSIVGCMLLGRMLERQDRPEEAGLVVAAGLAQFGEVIEMQRLLGLLHVRQGKLAEALPLVYAAYVRDPSDVAALNALGQICEAQGDLAEALQFYRAAIRLNPRHAPALIGLSRAHQLLGNERATEVLQGTFIMARLDEIAAGLRHRATG